MSALDTLKTFTTADFPDLDIAVLGALELLAEADLPETKVPFTRPLVIGSGNAIATGRIIFRDSDAVFADESSYQSVLDKSSGIDGVVIISASGGKHAIEIAAEIKRQELPTVLFTNNPDAQAKQYINEENVRVFPKNREPYTYNTSTYLSQIASGSGEQMSEIKFFIEKEVAAVLPSNLTDYKTYTFILPPEFAALREMLRTKFDELFGPKLCGRIFTSEEIKHAKTVVPDDGELFITLGEENTSYGNESNRLHIPLPTNSGYVAALAIGYYLVGQIQKAHPPYFKENIVGYCQEASTIFHQEIKPIIE